MTPVLPPRAPDLVSKSRASRRARAKREALRTARPAGSPAGLGSRSNELVYSEQKLPSILYTVRMVLSET